MRELGLRVFLAFGKSESFSFVFFVSYFIRVILATLSLEGKTMFSFLFVFCRVSMTVSVEGDHREGSP